MQELYPIKTYCEKLDSIIGGFYPGELTLICGEWEYGYDPVCSPFLFSLIRLITFGSGVAGILYLGINQPWNFYNDVITSTIGIQSSENSSSMNYKKNKDLEDFISKQIYDLPLVVRRKCSRWPDIIELCNEIKAYYKKKNIKIVYLDDNFFWISGDNCIEKHYFVIQKLKQLAQDLNIPIVINYLRKGIKVMNDEASIEIVKASSTIIDLSDRQYSGTSIFCQIPMRVLKTHDGKLGTYNLMFNPGTLTFL